MNLEQSVYSLPSTRAFINSVTDDPGHGVTIVLLPDNLSREMVGRQIRDRFGMMNLSFRELFDPGNTSPVMVSADAMGVTWTSGRTRRSVGNLLRSDNLPHTLYVHRIGIADASTKQGWKRFIEEWARESRAIRASENRAVPSLCVVAKLRDFDFELPAADSGIGYHWWWGFPSALEMRLACRSVSQREGGNEVSGRWREYVIPSLVANDVQLAEHVWSHVTEGMDRVIEGLADYWKSLDDPDCIEQDEIDSVIGLIKTHSDTYEVGQALPDKLRCIWAIGGLSYTPEYRLEIHPALLAYHGRRTDVEHRLWRGQAELLLPVANQVRLRVCEDLTEEYGTDWPVRWIRPRNEYEIKEVECSPLGAELGHIDNLLRMGRRSPTHPLHRKHYLIQLVSKAKNVRNDIAHYTPVAFERFVSLNEEMEKTEWMVV